MKRLLTLMCLGLACGSVVAQSISDVLCSIQERKAAVQQSWQVAAYLPSFSSTSIPDQELIDWTGLATTIDFPTEQDLAALGIEGRVALLNQAIVEFRKLSLWYMNMRPEDLAVDRKIGALRPYLREDFPELGRADAMNFHAQLLSLAKDTLRLRVLPWPFAGKQQTMSDTRGGLPSSGGTPSPDTEPSTLGQGELATEAGIWEVAVSDSAEGTAGWCAYLVEKVTATAKNEYTTSGCGSYSEIFAQQKTIYHSDVALFAKVPNITDDQIDGKVTLLARNAWSPAAGYVTAPVSWNPGEAAYQILAVEENASATKGLGDGPTITLTLSWFDVDPNGPNRDRIGLPSGFVDLMTWLQGLPEGYDEQWQLSWENGLVESSDSRDAYRALTESCVVRVLERKLYALCTPTFVQGLNTGSKAAQLATTECFLRPPAGDAAPVLNPVPGLLVGMPLGVGLDGSSLGWIGVSPGDVAFHRPSPTELYSSGIIYPDRTKVVLPPMVIRFDSAANLRFCGPAQDFHVVYATQRNSAARGAVLPSLRPDALQASNSGVRDFFTAWDLPRLRQVVSRDLIVDVSADGHYQNTIKIYRRPSMAGAVDRTPGTLATPDEEDLIRTLVISNPDAGTTAYPGVGEDIQIEEDALTHDVSQGLIGSFGKPNPIYFSTYDGSTELFSKTIAFVANVGRTVTTVKEGVTVSQDALTINNSWEWWDYQLPTKIDHTVPGSSTTLTIQLTNTFEAATPGSQEGRYPATTTIEYPDQPEVSIDWKGSGVVDGVTQGLWSTSYVIDGAELKGESQYNGSTVGTTWTVWSEGERVVTTYSAPDGSVTSKGADATDWSELIYGDYTGTGTGRPGLPHCMTRKDGSGMTWNWVANGDGSTLVEVREGLLANGAVTGGTTSVSTANGRGYVTDVEGILVQSEEELKVSGRSTPVGQFTTWGAPLKSTDFTTSLSDIREYDGNLERLVSHTDPLDVTTAITARDALGRVTEYNWKGHAGTVTPGALSVAGSLSMGNNLAPVLTSWTWDAMGRTLTNNLTVGGVTHAREATYNANTHTIATSNSLTGAGTSSTINNSTNALAATGTVLPFGGVTGDALSVENGLLLTKSKLTGKTNTYQSTWTDAWGRVRQTVTPSTTGTGEDTTEYVYSDPGSHIHRVTTLEPSGRRTIQESDPYNSAGAITRAGVDVNLDANGGYSLDDSDRYVLTTVTIDEGVLHTVVIATGEPTANGSAATRTILITDTDPATGIVTTVSNPIDNIVITGGEETITQQPFYLQNKVKTTSTKGWENTDTFNSLGLPTNKVLSGTGLAGSTLNSTWRDDGTLASATLIEGDPETGGATSTASLGNNGLLTGLTVPLLSGVFGGHSFANGTESIKINGTTRTASLDGTSTSTTGTDIMSQTRNVVVVEGSTFKNTIAPTGYANTVLTHNAAGAKTTHDYITGPGIATTWNASWELASISNGRGGSTIFEYSQDGARDLTDITYPGAGTYSAIHEEFTHYPSGKVKTISDPSGSRLLTYDRSRLWQSTYVNVGKALDGYEVERTTDAAGRLETVTVKHNGTAIHSYTNSFNASSHEISGVAATGFSSSYSRANPDTRAITKITRGTVEQNWGRGTAGRITSAGSSISEVPITGAPAFAYTQFDTMGRRKNCITAGSTWEYTYGTAGQLTAAGHGILGNISYPVDGIGRRTGSGTDSLNRFMAQAHSQQKQLIISTATTARLYINETEMTPFTGGWFHNIPSPGQDGGWVPWVVKGVLEDEGDHNPNDDAIAEVAGNTWVPPVNESFSYDADGNRESSSLWNYGWDGRNMLVSATTKNYDTSPEGWRVTCDYDAEGRRFKKTIIHKTTRGEQVKETQENVTFIWDGWNLIYERHANQFGTKTFDRKYVWGEDLGGGTGGASGAGGAGGLLLIRETRGQAAPVDYYPLYDGSGHVVGLTDSAGTLVAQYTYGPFGELISASGPMADANPIRYATKYYDKETGLYYFGRRYYDPATGQWLNREPLGEDESLNLYAYCHNDPINRVDVLGLSEYPSKGFGYQSASFLTEFADAMAWVRDTQLREPAQRALSESFDKGDTANQILWSAITGVIETNNGIATGLGTHLVETHRFSKANAANGGSYATMFIAKGSMGLDWANTVVYGQQMSPGNDGNFVYNNFDNAWDESYSALTSGAGFAGSLTAAASLGTSALRTGRSLSILKPKSELQSRPVIELPTVKPPPLPAAKGGVGAADDAGRYIYRTISPDDPHFGQFGKVGDSGVIQPRGGHNDLTRHVQMNETDSIFTSWSKNGPANWDQWGTPGHIQLRIDTHTLQNPALDVSRWSNFPWEEEISVIGGVGGTVRVR